METFPTRFGSYELIDLLAVGGMAEIFRARIPGQEPTLAKLAAVKRILPTFSKDPNFVKLFEKEIGLAAGLNHPNLVKIYDSGIVRNQYFIAMEYVHGKPLDKLASHCAEHGVPIPPDFSCFVVREVCNALDYAHNLKDTVSGKFVGIIHRDISPQNVIFSYEGHVKLFDFGVAKVMSRDSSTVGGFQGKPAYMAPEQARGEDLDNRTDIFSLGVVLWELLTGQRLFYSEQPLLAIKNVTEKAIPVPSSLNPKVPKVLDAVVMKALQRPQDQRYQSAQQFGTDLTKVMNTLRPGYGEAHASKFIETALGELIEQENAELYERMHAQADTGLYPGGLEITAETSIPGGQPEWRRAKAEKAFQGEKKGATIAPPPLKPRAPVKSALDDVQAPVSSNGVWALLGLLLLAGFAYGAYEMAGLYMKAANVANAPPPPPKIEVPVAAAPPVAAAQPVPAVRDPAKQAPNPSALRLDSPETAAPACNSLSRQVCAFSNGAPTTFLNSCMADAAKALTLYTGQCDPKQNPAVRFKVFRLHDTEWHWAADTQRAAVFGEALDIDLEPVNFPPSLRMQLALITADGKTVKVEDLVAPTAVLNLGKDLARGFYDLEARITDDKGVVLFVNKANQPFFLGEPSDIKMKVLHQQKK